MSEDGYRLTKWFGSWGIGLGVAAGLATGAALVSRTRDKRMPKAAVYQSALQQQYDVVDAALLMAQVEMRYRKLLENRPRFTQWALRDHLEANILPGLALYQIFLEKYDNDQAAALAVVEQVMKTALAPQLQQQVAMLDRLPNAYPVFRQLVRLVMKYKYPAEGWEVTWKQDDENGVALDISQCLYARALAHYGAPELTEVFCRTDDWMYEANPSFIRWERTQTLGQGAACCDFRWSRADGVVHRENGYISLDVKRVSAV